MPSDAYDPASRDPLTGALTRHTFTAAIDRLIAHAAPNDSCAILVLDIDHFKSINDSFGHTRGDETLVEAVARITAVLRSGDLLFRFGGDEFVILLSSITPGIARQVAERILEHVRHEPFAGTPPLHITLSIGVAIFPQDAANAASLFEIADQRAYHAKRTGRGRVVAFDPPNVQILPTAPERLIERDGVLTAFQEWLLEPSAGSRSFCLQAPDASGRTRILSEFARAAVAQGYGVLAIYGDPALRMRHFGALTKALQDWDMPAPTLNSAFVSALARYAQRYPAGMLILVDDPLGIDPDTLELLREIFNTARIDHLTVVYVDGPIWKHRPPFDTAPQKTHSLLPISSMGIRVWLRQMLQWEPPETLVAWVATYSAGLPAWIKRAIETLTMYRALIQEGHSWHWDSNLASAIPPRPMIPDEILLQIATLPQLLGRDAETEQLQTWLLSERLVTIVGPGGVGKTRLALQAAAEMRMHFRDGVYVVLLAGVESASHIPAAIARALPMEIPETGDLRSHVTSYVRSRELLFVLDNVEHVLDGMQWLPELLHAAPGLRILVTSRERMGLLHERVLWLDGLALAENNATDMSAAAQLFIQHARLTHPDFVPQQEDMPYIDQICSMLNGLPLGIELAASWVQSYTCAEILAGLMRSLDFLHSTQRDIPARHRRVTLVLDSFWALLSPYEQQAVQALAVFRGGFTRDAAWHVAGASPFLLDGLLAKTFLRRTNQGRFVIHELLRQYAAERLARSDTDKAAAHDRHSAYYLRLMTNAYAKPDRAPDGLDGMVIELDNLRAAWRWAVEQRNFERIAACIHAFGDVMAHIGVTQESLELHRTVLALLEELPSSAEHRELAAKLELICGVHLTYLGNLADALATAQRAASHIEGIDAPRVMALMHFTTGMVQIYLGDRAQSHMHLQQALALYVDDERMAVRTLSLLTHQMNFAGKSELANRYADEAIQRARASGYVRDELRAMTFQGIGYTFQERQYDAIHLFEQVLIQRIGDRYSYIDMLALTNLAQALWEVQEYSRAAVTVERTLWIARNHDLRHIEGMISRLRGLVMLSLADLAQSESSFMSALLIFEQSSAHRDRARTHAEYALMLYRQGEYHAALAQIEAALEVARRYEVPLAAGHGLAHRGHVLLAIGNPAGAIAAYQQAHGYLLNLGRRNRAAEVAAAWGLAELVAGHEDSAYQRATAAAAHLAGGATAFGGMYDPVQMCLNTYDVLHACDPSAAAAILQHMQALFSRIHAALPTERAAEVVEATPSLQRFQALLDPAGERAWQVFAT